MSRKRPSKVNASAFRMVIWGPVDSRSAAGMVASGHPVNVVAEPLGYEPMNELIQDFRRRLDISVIPANKATSSVMRCLHRGEVLAMMFDVRAFAHPRNHGADRRMLQDVA